MCQEKEEVSSNRQVFVVLVRGELGSLHLPVTIYDLLSRIEPSPV